MSRTIAGIVGQAGTARRPPAPLAGDQLVAVVDAADQHRLEHADLADRGGELGERLLVEVDPRLVGLGTIWSTGISSGRRITGVRRGRLVGVRDQRAEPYPVRCAEPSCTSLATSR